MLAAMCGEEEIVKAFLDALEDGHIIDARDSSGRTAVILCAANLAKPARKRLSSVMGRASRAVAPGATPQ